MTNRRCLMGSTVYDFSARTIFGEEKSLIEFEGKVLLIVNTASKCGFTPQFAGLEDLYQRYRDRGLVVLGFPCNQFLHQDPGSPGEILEFCQVNYGVTFPMFDKVDVRGKNKHPLYGYLTKAIPGALGTGAIKWNFTKFLIGRDGRPVKRFAPQAEPAKIAPDIEKLLQGVHG
jgi:glutathione peroxidase